MMDYLAKLLKRFFLNQTIKTDIRYMLVKLVTRVLNWQFETQQDFF
jgi:hypothetical protein